MKNGMPTEIKEGRRQKKWKMHSTFLFFFLVKCTPLLCSEKCKKILIFEIFNPYLR